MLGIVYFGGTLPAEHDTAIKVATSAGTVVGQVGFGVLADIVGRKKMVSGLACPSIRNRNTLLTNFTTVWC